MVSHGAVIATVITENARLLILVLLWHRILYHVLVDLLPPIGHVAERLLTNGAPIVALSIVIQTLQVHVMAALKDANRLHRCEHVLGTDWAVAVQGILEADVVIEDGKVDATATFLTVLVIDSETLANATQPTVLAMKD